MKQSHIVTWDPNVDPILREGLTLIRTLSVIRTLSLDGGEEFSNDIFQAVKLQVVP